MAIKRKGHFMLDDRERTSADEETPEAERKANRQRQEEEMAE